MILDPERHGCRIWYNNATTFINGNVRDICNEIYKRVTIVTKANKSSLVTQFIAIYVYPYDVGAVYIDTLKEMGLHVEPINLRIIDDIIPITNVESVSITK